MCRYAIALIAVGFIALVLAQCADAKDLWGYVDQKGTVVVEPQFFNAGVFMHGFARCWEYSSETGKRHSSNAVFIDKTERRYETGSPAGNQFRTRNDAYEEFDINGHHIVQDTFQTCTSRNQLNFLRRRNDSCVSDSSGHILKLIPPTWSFMGENPRTGNQWCKVGNESYEFTGVTKSDMPGFEPIESPIDVPAGYDYCEEFHEGLAAAMTKDGHWVYVDADGQVRIELPKDCSNAQPFSEGLAAVSIGGKPWTRNSHGRIASYNGATFGFIDKSGKFVIPPRFPCPHNRWTSQFQNGLAVATGWKNADIAFGFMDRKGTFVVAPIYKAVGEFGDGLAAVNAGPVGFDRDNWDQQIDDIESGYYRIHQFAQFLRQFDFIGMPRSQAQALLGPPNETARDTHHESYILQSSDDGPTEAVVQYRNDKVFAYRVGAGAYWVTSNVKPDFEDALNAFSIQHGDKKAAAQSGKRRFRNF